MLRNKGTPAGFCLLLLFILLTPWGTWAQTSWKGTTSTTWGNTANWTAGIPDANTDAIIGDTNFTGIFQPTLTRNSTCKSLVIGTGPVAATLTVSKALSVRGALTIGPNGTITHSGRTITLLGDWTNSGVYNATKQTAAVAFGGSTTQTVNGATTFRKVAISAGSTVALQTPVSVASTLTVSGILDPGDSPTHQISGAGSLTVNAGGLLFVKAASFAGNYTLPTTLNAASIVDYAATQTNQTISSALTYGTLRISGAGTKTLAGNLPALNSTTASAGNILLTAGTLDLASFTANRGTTVAGGAISVASGATLKIGGANTFPANYASHQIHALSTVEYSGTSQSISAETYGTLILSSSSGVAIKTMPATAMTVAGNLISKLGSGSSVSFTAGATVSIMGNLSLGAGTTFNGGAFAHSIAGNLVNEGAFHGNTGVLTLSGTGAGISGSGSNLFNTLTVSGAGVTIASNTQVSVAGDLSTSLGGTLIHQPGGTGVFAMTGSGKSISGMDITLNNLQIDGSITASNSLTVSGNLAVTGSFSAASGALTLSGTGKTISGAGALALYALNVPGSITATAGFSLSSDLSVAGSLTATTGTVTFIGTSSFSGLADLFDVTLAGTRLVLGTGSILGIGHSLTLTAGIFDTTSSIPNTVKYYTGGTQSVLSATYHNLLLTGTGTQTATGPLTIAGDLSISGNTTFSAGGYTHSLQGNWINSGAFNPETGTVELHGSQDCSVSGTTTFNALVIGKAAPGNQVTLNSDIIASTVNIATGSVYTGTNTITITSNRTGNGSILGTITRTHEYAAGIPYAFESPFNTITFATVSGITSATVRVEATPPADFPYGNSINRQYILRLAPTGTYTATLRLHYQDTELNGNIESTIALWHKDSLWTALGKSANSSADNWVEQGGLTNLSGHWTCSDDANVAGWNGSISTDWATAGNWSVIDGSPTLPPSLNDTAEIGMQAFSHPPVITSTAVVKNITFGSVQPADLSLGSGGSLRVAGNLAGDWTTNASHRILVNGQLLVVDGDLILSDGIAEHTIGLEIGTGVVAIAGTLAQSAGASIAFSGGGQLSIGRDYIYGGGAFTAGTGTVIYNGNLAQTVAGGITYNNLTFNKTGGTATLPAPAYVGGNLLLATGGTFMVNAALVVTGKVEILAGATLDGDSSSLSVGGDWIREGAFVPNSGTVTFNGTGTQSIASSTFYTLRINKTGGSATLSGNLIIGSDLIVAAGTLDLATNTANRSVVGGAFTLAGGTALRIGSGSTFPANFAAPILSGTSTVEYYGGLQSIAAESYGNLVLSNGGEDPKSLAGATTVSGDLVINSGATLSGSSYSLNVLGNWTNNGNFMALSGSVTLGGASKTVHGTNVFNNLVVPGSYSFAGAVSVNGSLLVSGSCNAGGSPTLLAGNFINSGLFLSSGTVTFAGTVTQTLALNAGFTSSGTVNFDGSQSPIFSDSTSPTFHNTCINNSAGVTPNVGWTLNGAFIVNSNAVFNGGTETHVFHSDFTNNGSVTSSGTLLFTPAHAVSLKMRGLSFSSSGDVIFSGTSPVTVAGDELAFSSLHIANTHPSGVTPTTHWTVGSDLIISGGATLNGGTGLTLLMTGNWINNGTFNGQSSTVAFNGTSGISGVGSSLFNNLTVTGTVTATSDFDVHGDFYNNGTFDGTGISVTFAGAGPSTLGGSTSPTPFDTLIINKSGATVTVSVNVTNVSSLTVNSGTLDLSTHSLGQDILGGSLSISADAKLKIGGSSSLPVFDAYSFDPASTVEYYGSGAQTISAQNFGHLTSSSSGTRTFATSAPIGIAGVFTPGSNVFTVTGSTLVYNGATPQTIVAFNYHNLSNASTGARILDPSGTIGIAGFFAPGSNPCTNSGSSINFNGANQTIPAFSYYNLLTSGTGLKTIGGTVVANGALTLSGGSLTNAGFTVTVNGNIANAVTCTGTGKIMMANGTLPHSLSGTGSFFNVELNDTNGATLLASMTVNGALILTEGQIATSTNRVLLGANGSVARTSGHINGNLQKPVATGNPVRTFEIGDTTHYTPLTLQFTNVTVAGNVMAQAPATEHPDIGNSGVFPQRDLNGYWSVTNLGTVFSNLKATFTFPPQKLDVGATPTNFIVALKSGGVWSHPVIAARTSTNLQATGITSLGDYVIGEPVPNLLITSPNYDQELPFRSVLITATGNGTGLVGTVWFTNQWAGGIATGSFPASSSWSTLLSLPDHGQYTFTVFGSNAVGTLFQESVRFHRKPSRIYWLNHP